MAEYDGEKTQDPTPHHREQARQQGQVAKSQDLGSAALLILAMWRSDDGRRTGRMPGRILPAATRRQALAGDRPGGGRFPLEPDHSVSVAVAGAAVRAVADGGRGGQRRPGRLSLPPREVGARHHADRSAARCAATVFDAQRDATDVRPVQDCGDLHRGPDEPLQPAPGDSRPEHAGGAANGALI